MNYKERNLAASYTANSRALMSSLAVQEAYGTINTSDAHKLKSLRRLRAEEIGCIVDPDDEWILENHTWCMSRNGYAHTSINGKSVTLQRLIHSFMTGKDLDSYRRHDHVRHVKPNPLDCRRSNIHIEVGAHLNALDSRSMKQSNNTSGCSGVHWHKQKSKWNVIFKLNGTPYSLGLYDEFESAVYARKEMIKIEKAYVDQYGIDWWYRNGPTILRDSWKDIRDEWNNNK